MNIFFWGGERGGLGHVRVFFLGSEILAGCFG